jgi:hypothetical protein
MLSALLKDNSRTPGKLCTHIDFLINLQARLCRFLAPPMNAHCTVANCAHDTLVLHADSPAWATKLRYHTTAILAYMQNAGDLPSLKTIRIKVVPVSKQAPDTPVRPLSLSSASARLINQVAAGMPDGELRLSLLKLARHNQERA